MTLIRRSLDHTIVQLDQTIIANQMVQDPLLVSHQQREKRMLDGELNIQRKDSIFLSLYHFLHGSNTVFSTIGCSSFQTSVTVFQVYLFTRVFQHMFQSLLIVRSHLQTGISRAHDCKKMFHVFQTLTFAWNNSTKAFASGSSVSQHSDGTVGFFESDTREIERGRLGVHSTWLSGNSARLHADFTTVVMLSVAVDLVSMFLLQGSLTSEVDR